MGPESHRNIVACAGTHHYLAEGVDHPRIELLLHPSLHLPQRLGHGIAGPVGARREEGVKGVTHRHDPAQQVRLARIAEPRIAAAVGGKVMLVAHHRRGLEGMAKHTLAVEAGRLADQEFHSALLRASGNEFVISLTSGVGAAISWTTVFKQRDNPLPRDPVPDHVRVYDAIKASDPDAAHKAMESLVDLAFLDTTNSRRPRKK